MSEQRGAELDERTRGEFAERVARELGAEQALVGGAGMAYAIQGVRPAVVARPNDQAALLAALRLAAEAGATVAPWGAGSRMALGYPPKRLDLALSLERLNRVVSYDPADLTITVEAGMTHAALEMTLAEARQTLPLDPPLPGRATLGGTLATGITGMRRARYGAPRDVALGMRVADVAGEMTRAGGSVVKNSTGYGMTRLYIGSLGTLGVITEASFKLTPMPEAEATVIVTCASAQVAQAAAQAVNGLALRPAAVVALHVAALPELARLAPAQERRALLAIRLAGTGAAAMRAAREAETALRGVGATPLLTLEGAGHADFWASVNDFPALRAHAREALLRVNTLPGEAAQALDMALGLASEHGLRALWLSDLATGTLWLRLSEADDALAPGMPVGDSAAEGEAVGRALLYATALRLTLEALIRRYRLVTTLACPAQLKAGLAVWGADPSGLDLMREVKRRFDPHHRLNPGRFVGGV